MNRMLFIAISEYVRQVTRRGFLIALFGMPIFMGAMVLGAGVVVALSLVFDKTEKAIGYVDQAGIISENLAIFSEDSDTNTNDNNNDGPIRYIPLKPYPDMYAAHTAFVADERDAYVVVPPNYLDTGTVMSYGTRSLSYMGKTTLRLLLRKNLLFDQPSDVARRARYPIYQFDNEMISPPDETVAGMDESSKIATIEREEWFFFLSFMLGMIALGTIFSSVSYLLHAMVDEKENRTMEIVMTSVSPKQFIGGKTLGLSALGLTQALVWLLYIVGPVAIGAIFVEDVRPAFFSLMTEILPLATLFFIPFYLLYAGIIIFVGSIVGSIQEGQQLASFSLLPIMIPFFLMGIIAEQPDGALAVGTTLFPPTALLSVMIRSSFIQIPLWQLALSLVITLTFVVLFTLISGRIFRWGMLRYGKRFSLRELFKEQKRL